MGAWFYVLGLGKTQYKLLRANKKKYNKQELRLLKRLEKIGLIRIVNGRVIKNYKRMIKLSESKTKVRVKVIL